MGFPYRPEEKKSNTVTVISASNENDDGTKTISTLISILICNAYSVNKIVIIIYGYCNAENHQIIKDFYSKKLLGTK